MANKDTKNPIPFSVMNGEGDSLVVGDKSYTVNPMLVGDALNFLKEGLSIGAQIFNLANPKSKDKLDEYLSKYCADENGEPMSIEKAIKNNWNVVHLKSFISKLCDMSG